MPYGPARLPSHDRTTGLADVRQTGFNSATRLVDGIDRTDPRVILLACEDILMIHAATTTTTTTSTPGG
jgi:hypothetical protein